MLIVAAIGLTLLRLFPFAIEFYKKDLEHKIFELTSIPVEIGDLKANLRGINPEVILKDIRILSSDGQGTPSIELDQVRVGIDLVQLLSTRQLLPSSWLTLVGAKLSIVRNKDGRLSIIGLNSDNSKQPLWLLNGGRYEVLKSEITWLDKKRQKSPVTFNDVDLLIKNNADEKSHELHLLIQLPEQYGEKLRISMSVQGNIYDVENITGWVFVEGNAIHLAEVFKEEELFGVKITDLKMLEENKSSFTVWSQWNKSALKELSGSIQVENIALKQNKKVLDIKLLDTAFDLSVKDADWQFGVKNFAIKTGKYEWPLMEFSMSANQQLTHLAASATRIELQVLTELASFFVPLNKKKEALISALNLKGELKDFSIYVDRDTNSYAVNGGFNNIFVNAVSGFPQIKNLTGAIKGTDESGNIRLFSKNVSFSQPKLFKKATSLDNFSGSFDWQQLTDTWFIKSESFMLNNKDIETISRLSLTIPKNDAPVFMDLQTSFFNIQNIRSLVRYFPISMKTETVNWLKTSFVSGEIPNGNLLIYGELNRFPFVENGLGVFEVLFQAKNVEWNYSPNWPHVDKMDAAILFAKNALSVDITSANTHGLNISAASVKIPSFVDTPHIQIQSQLVGSIADGLVYLQQTPVRELADKVLDSITPEGLTQVDLDLDIQLSENTEIKLNGVAHMEKAALTINSIGLDVTDIEGELKFSEQGIFSDNMKAKALGYPIAINADSDELKTVIVVKGETDYLQLKKQFSFLNNDLIKDEQIEGSSIYTATMNLPKIEKNSAELAIKTNLLGIDLGLPSSLQKPAEQETPFLLSMPLNEEGLLPISINYKDELKAAINLDRQQSEIYSAHIVYGKGDALISEKKGIVLSIDQDIFDGSEWMGFVKQASKSKDNLEEEAKQPALKHMVLKAKELRWQGQSYGSFEMILQQLDEKWQGNILSSFARGAFIFPFNQLTEKKIKLEMEQLNLTQLMSIKIPTDTDDEKIENMPLFDVVSQQLWWKSVDLGKLEIVTEKITDGIRFKHIKVISKDYKINLNGDWVNTDEGSITAIQSGRVKVNNFGKILSQLDITDDIKETHGYFDFTASWQGLPYQFSLPSVDAEIDLNFKDGRVSSIEPGFGRLLGLIAMEQWIKRLRLDFSDVFKAGLSFNKISGHLKLREGILKYKDLMVDAIPANISISGGINLLEKTLDQRVSVVPKSSAAIPIAGPIVEGIAGVITQVFDENYKEGYFFGSEYEVNGKWNNLKVTPIHD